MSKYKIKVIAHQLKNQVIAKYGDLVDETQLLGNASELANLGFVELIEDEAVEKEADLVDETQLLGNAKKSKKDVIKQTLEK